jgi:hypothetical protein
MNNVPFLDFDASSGMDTNDEHFLELKEYIMIARITMMASYNTYDVLNANGSEDGGQTIVNTNKGIVDILGHMREVPPLFKVLQLFITSFAWRSQLHW